ncbi:MAG: CBS domain-containing protein [Rhodospirillaceae bacterium]|jgi:CBS domain-containing protein|nr:CBS domain-containing protein [Rhodospirillaceae bacterium]MBT6136632.1 CBS domain-containing protein [Rhodospirillaceae bacterium]
MEQITIADTIERQDLATTTADRPVREVVRMMTERHIGAVPVLDGEHLIGIFTERDVMTRVLDKGLDADTTAIGKVMTAAPRTVDPSLTILEALAIMAEGGYRHLPVVVDGDLVAIISIRDLYAAVTGGLEEDILALTSGVM